MNATEALATFPRSRAAMTSSPFARLVLAGSLALACVAPSPAAQVTVGMVPPVGWKKLDLKGANLLAAWGDPSTKVRQNVTLAHDDDPLALDRYVAAVTSSLGGSLRSSNPVSHKLTICGNRPAYEIETDGMYDTLPVHIDELVTDIGGKKFIGTYTRPRQTPASRAATDSLKTICPKS